MKLEGFAFPAYILPLTIIVTYLLSRPYWHYDHASSTTSGKEADTDAFRRKGITADAENQIPYQHEEHPRWKKWLRNTVRAYQHLWTFQALLVQRSNPYRLYPTFSCLAEAIALTLTGCVLEKDTFKPCVAAANGWVALWLFQERIGVSSIPTSVGTAALAVPCAFMLGQSDDYWSPTSAVLLLALTADPYIAADSPIRTPKLLGGQLWPVGMMVPVSYTHLTLPTKRIV